jgi:hypothetical protein
MPGVVAPAYAGIISRRGLLRGILPLGLAALYPETLLAAGECQPAGAPGLAACSVGLRSPIADRFARRQPAQSQWCWAACIEMVAAYYGFALPQEQVVAEIYGGAYDRPADAQVIVSALSRPWRDADGRDLATGCEVIYAAGYSPPGQRPDLIAIERLYGDMPIIIGTVGHAMVLSALDFIQMPDAGEASVTGAVVRDPWPESPGRRNLSPQEWYGIQLAVVPRFQAL